ncbi:tryptophan-rich sensory protein [Pradoshia sp.]
MNRKILNTIFFLLVIITNALANLLPINGKTTGELSNQINVLITPAGYAFSIWSLIYVLIGIWIIRQFIGDKGDSAVYTNTSAWFILSSLFNIVWIIVWHYELFMISVIIMLLYLVSLIMLYRKLTEAGPTFFDKAPFSINLGWISVATIVNIAYVLKFNGWDGFGLTDETWTVIMLIVGTILAVIFRLKERDFLYPLVFVWAYIAIGVKNYGEPDLAAYTAFILAGIILVADIIPWRKK